MNFTGKHLYLQGDGHSLASISDPERMAMKIPDRFDLGVFLANTVLVLSPHGEDHSHTVRREIPDVSLIYPWGRDDYESLGDIPIRMIGREVTADFRRKMVDYYTSPNNPDHFFMNQETKMFMMLAF